MRRVFDLTWRRRYLTAAALTLIFAVIVSVSAFGKTSSTSATARAMGTTVPTVDSCGYPTGTTGRPATTFNESTTLAGFSTFGTGSSTRVAAFYSDEHALTLGLNTINGSITPFVATYKAPGSNTASADDATNPSIGDAAGADPSNRPIYPALFLTDITNGASNAGDWQQQANNSTAIAPNFVAGTWKADNAVDPAAKNNFFLGPNVSTAEQSFASGLSSLGYGSEIVWNASSLGALPGHTYRVQFMVHDGDQNKAGGDVGEGCTTFSIPKLHPTMTTSASNDTIGVTGGANVHDTATLSDGTANAIGTLTYHLYSDSGCSSEVANSPVTRDISLTPGPGANGKSYQSPDVNVTTAGNYYWKVSYSGDGSNDPILLANVPCGSAANNELSVVSPRTPTLATSASNATIGQLGSANVHDTATLSDGTAAATGTLTYHLYSDSACSSEVANSPVTRNIALAPGPGANGVAYQSPDINVTTAGSYYWKVSYGGDTNNNPILLANVACGTLANTEVSVVSPRSPTVSTVASGSVTIGSSAGVNLHDTATLKGGTTNATGTLFFHLFKDNGTGCDVEQGSGVTRTVNTANGGAGTTDVPETGVSYLSPNILVTTPGTYHWRVSFTGDTNNNDIPLTACSALGESTDVLKASPNITTQLQSGNPPANVSHVAVGTAVNDTATLTSATSDAGGTVTYTVYDNSSCASNANNRDAGTKTVTNGIVPASNSLTLPAGTFYWQAVYNPDSNNNGATSLCSSEALSVVALSIEKHATVNGVAGNAAHVGDTVGFSVTVTGSGPALGVTLSDPLANGPSGNPLTWTVDGSVTATGGLTPPTCAVNTVALVQTLSCTAVDLGTGSNFATAQSYTVKVKSPTSATGTGFTINNIATASSTNHDDVLDNDSFGGETGTDNKVEVSALTIVKQHDAALVQAGNPIGFTITVTGSGPAKGVILTDDLPVGPSGSGVSWGPASQTATGDFAPTCTIATVASHVVTFTGPPSHSYTSTQRLTCTTVASMGTGADFSTPQSFTVHVTSPTLATSASFVLFNFGCASSSNATQACDADTTAGDNDNNAGVIGKCVLGYPDSSNAPRSSATFNESTVFAGFVGPTASDKTVKAFYTDEHALTLGIHSSTVNGVTHTAGVTAMTKHPADHTVGPVSVGVTGTNLADPFAAKDSANRPMWPSLFVTDITSGTHNQRDGDWQQGTLDTRNAIVPSNVFGSWKGEPDSTRTLTGTTTSIFTGTDPVTNGTNLDGGGGFTYLKPLGFTSEIVWDVSGLTSGHVYRLEFMAHDGDHSGDSAEACVNFIAP